MDKREQEQLQRWGNKHLVHCKLHELDITSSGINLRPGYLRYLIWKTDAPVNKVILTNGEGSKVEYDEIDFCCLERQRVNKSELKDGWGAIYLCLEPDKLDVNTGGIIICNMHVEFQPKTSGTLWQFCFDYSDIQI